MEISERFYGRLTAAHLDRLYGIAVEDHEQFFAGHPDYRNRVLSVVLAQGAAKHWVGGRNGVKDLDVWSFFARIPGERFPADRRSVHRDFGFSDLGRQPYDLDAAPDQRSRTLLSKWAAFAGRRVDLLMRALPVAVGTDAAEAIPAWLRQGQQRASGSAWWLAQKAVVLLDPARRGDVVWDGSNVGNPESL
jgi:hypothetical protein